MTRTLTLTIFAATLALSSGCANSVLNDPEEMARRQAETAASTAAWNSFWGNAISINEIDYGSGGSAPAPSVGTYEPPRCYQVSDRYQTCWN